MKHSVRFEVICLFCAESIAGVRQFDVRQRTSRSTDYSGSSYMARPLLERLRLAVTSTFPGAVIETPVGALHLK